MSAEKSSPVHKVVITGTGRAGTTFLVRLLTELGLDTGYTRRNWSRDYFAHCEAGLEHDLAKPGAPYIVKNPALCETLESILAEGRVVIDHAYIPIRELDAAAASRVRIGGANGNVPGGLLKTSDPSMQKAVLAEMFHRLVFTLVAHEIPHTFLLFPRFARNADYAYARLKFLLDGVSPETFRDAFARVADPGLIHDFSRPENRPVGLGAEPYFQMQRRKRRARHTVRWTLAGAAACLMGFYPARHKLLSWHFPAAVSAAIAPVRSLLR
ncbi:MAG TPA: hypothetical protein VMI53_13265 [Opitutaceae bacterium]|nr:hypothetical protein [Opitutaceae bacterium]